MLIVQCARRELSLIYLIILFILSLAALSKGAETVILNISLNQESKGDFFVIITEDKDFLVRTSDLASMGFREPEEKVLEIDGEAFMSLRSMKGIEFTFHESTLSLDITASPRLLPKRTIDFLPGRQPKVYYPEDKSAFFNYRFDYSAGDSFNFQSFYLTNQLGIRTGNLLFLTDSSYKKTKIEEKFSRLMSNITYDRRDDLQRIILGDFFASSGELGSSINLGGLSFSKVYLIDPYFIRQPMADFSGSLSLPSDVEVYLDGMRLRTERLSPGEFDLKNIFYYGGVRVIEVVIKDPFGREERLRYPFYFTDVLLKKGLHEYSYNIGFLREDFGIESNRYGDLIFSAFHRYGFNNSLTFGLRSEGEKARYNLGPQASCLIGNSGIVTLSVSGSYDTKEKYGLAGLLSYLYQDKRINASLFLKGFTEEYVTIGKDINTERTKYEASAGIGYGTQDFGSINVNFTTIKKYQGQDRRMFITSYSKSLYGKATIFLTFRNIREKESANEFFVGINFYPWKDTSLSTSYEKTGDAAKKVLQAQKNPPVGKGYGFITSFESRDTHTDAFNTFLQYNSKYNIYTGEFNWQKNGGSSSENYRFSLSGGLAYVGNTIGFSRPITDSFGLVKVGELEGIRVYQSNQEIGRTDSSGKVFIPTLNSYYENQISINDKDIPIEYSLSEIVKYVSPPLRGGAVVKFDVEKIQAITGMLRITVNGEVRPAEFYEVSMIVDDEKFIFPTGKYGEFYIENIKPGRYKASFEFMGKQCSFDIIVPETDDMIIDLEEVMCAVND
jgi:outer membrane usher protein